MITIEQLECFMLASETLNFTTTAKKLYMTQPAVTHQMQNLELEIGAELFERRGRHLSLTSAGIGLRDDLVSILPSLKRAIERARSTAEESLALFSLGCSPSLMTKWLSRALGRYNSMHADGGIAIQGSDALTLPALVESHAVDAAICIDSELESPDTLSFVPLFKTQYRVFFPADDSLASLEVVSTKDLEKRRVIVYKGGGGRRKQLGKGFSSLVSGGLKFSDVLPVNDAAKGIVMAASNLGIYVGLSAEEEYAQSFSLESRPIRVNLPPCTIGLLFRSDNENPIINDLITIIKNLARSAG